MITKIQTINNPLNNKTQKSDSRQPANTSFCSRELISQADSFDTQANEETKQNNALEMAMMATTGGSITVLGLTHARLGGIIKSVGEKAPSSFFGRLSKISEMSSKDSMTGLYNKATLLASIDKDYKNAMQNGENFSVAMLDMDNFKGINEVFDHKTGDIVLIRIAANINEVAQKYGAKSFRYGGEEFVVTLAGQDTETTNKMITEIADSIKKDKIIQDYLPSFKEKANDDIKFLDTALTQLNSFIFPNIRGRKGDKVDDYGKVATNIILLVENHIEKYDPSNKKVLTSIVDKLKAAKPEELPTLLSVNTKFGETTLGVELDKIHSQYAGMKNDHQKWINHVNQHNMFTISGGIVNLTNANVIKNSETPIKIADAALKSAKENGKNIVIVANDDLINKTIERVDK